MNRSHLFFSIVFLLFLLAPGSVLFAQGTFTGLEFRGEVPAGLSEKFKDFKLYTFDYEKLNKYVHRNQYNYEVKMEVGEHKWELLLFPNDIRSTDATISVMTEHGRIEKPKLPNSNYIGHVKGTAQKVAFSITERFFIGSLRLDEGEVFIEAVHNLVQGAPDNMYIVYRSEDVKPVAGITCGVDAGKRIRTDIEKKAHQIEQRAACYEMEVGYAADWDYNQAHGGVNGAVSYMSSIVNLMAANWDDEFANEIQVLDGPSFVSDCASCDPWSQTTNASGLLAEFASWGQGGGLNGPYATATLWVTRDISGSVVGIAYLSNMCHGYNVCEDFTSATNTLRQLQAHEIGHNYGCQHTANGIMAPSVNGSSFWHPASVATVDNNTPWSCMGQCLNGSTPIADFGALSTTGCAPFDAEFLDFSENATQWNWQFEGGIPSMSTEQNPKVTYLTKGTYGVTLTVSNNYGDDTKEIFSYIVVRDIPNVNFSFENAFGTNEVQFTDRTDDPEYWTWDFDDGEISDEQNPMHIYEQDGTYEVTLTVTNACGTDYYTDFIDIITPVEAKFSADTTRGCGAFCSNFNVIKNNNVDQYHWSFPGGTPSSSSDANPRVCYSKPGVYKVFLRVENQISEDTLTINQIIRVDSNSLATYRDTMDAADSLRLYFFDHSYYYDSITWDFGDTSFVEDTIVIRRLDQTDSVMAILDSFAQVTLPATYRLDSVDVHFLKDSIYEVQLITHGYCSDDTTVQTVVAGKIPVASILASATGCMGTANLLVNGSTPNATRWKWIITKGQSQETYDTKDLSWSPTEEGTYTLQLIAQNGVGSDTAMSTITIIGAPTAEYSYMSQGTQVNFTSQANNAGSHFWDFGDGMTSAEASPQHAFTDLGSYDVTYIVENECGSDTIVKRIDLTQLKANYSIDAMEGCAPLTIHLRDESTGATSVEWILGGSNTPSSVERELDVTYSQSGVYEIVLIAHKGAESDTSKGTFVTVDDSPVPEYQFSIADLTVQFTNTSTGSRLQYEWDFGDGTTSMEEHPKHEYTSPGKYNVSLKASNTCGTNTWLNEVNISGTSSKDVSVANRPDMVLYPNPAHRSFSVGLRNMEGLAGNLKVYDIRNRQVASRHIHLPKGEESIQLDCSDWAAGLYYVTFSSKEQVFVRKIIVR